MATTPLDTTSLQPLNSSAGYPVGYNPGPLGRVVTPEESAAAMAALNTFSQSAPVYQNSGALNAGTPVYYFPNPAHGSMYNDTTPVTADGRTYELFDPTTGKVLMSGSSDADIQNMLNMVNSQLNADPHNAAWSLRTPAERNNLVSRRQDLSDLGGGVRYVGHGALEEVPTYNTLASATPEPAGFGGFLKVALPLAAAGLLAPLAFGGAAAGGAGGAAGAAGGAAGAAGGAAGGIGSGLSSIGAGMGAASGLAAGVAPITVIGGTTAGLGLGGAAALGGLGAAGLGAASLGGGAGAASAPAAGAASADPTPITVSHAPLSSGASVPGTVSAVSPTFATAGLAAPSAAEPAAAAQPSTAPTEASAPGASVVDPVTGELVLTGGTMTGISPALATALGTGALGVGALGMSGGGLSAAEAEALANSSAANANAGAVPGASLSDKLSGYLGDAALVVGAAGNLFGGNKSGSGANGTVPAGVSDMAKLKPIFSASLPTSSNLLPGGGANSPRQMPQQDWNTYAFRPEQSFFTNVPQQGLAKGGLPEQAKPVVQGPLGGRSDDRPVMVSPGEYVVDAETVSMLGNGDTKSGAKALDQFRVNVRKHKGRALAKGRISPNSKRPEHYMAGGLSHGVD